MIQIGGRSPRTLQATGILNLLSKYGGRNQNEKMVILAGTITILLGLYLISLLIVTLLRKKSAIIYFSSFASSAKAHYLEQLLRLIAGLGLLIYSEKMLFPELFGILGWALIAPSILLLITPWKWHNKFGEWAIPFTIKNLILYSVSASIMGLVILYCVIVPLV